MSIDTINTLIQIIIAFLVILVPFGFVGGIIIASQLSQPQHIKRKKAMTIWAITLSVLPIVLLLIILSLWGLVRIMTNTVTG